MEMCWLDRIPISGVFILTVIVVLFSIGLGTFLGNRKRSQADHATDTSLGTIIGATLALLAFILTFTFGIALERHQTRMQLLLEEVNAISTAYLRADFLPEPHRSEIRNMLHKYVDIHASLAGEDSYPQPEKISEALSRGGALVAQMWSHAVAIARADPGPEDALFITSLNEMFDRAQSRITVFKYRIPTILWDVLYSIIILATAAVGYQCGLSGSKQGRKIGLILALTLSLVVSLIADLDRSTEGYIRVSQQPIFDLQKRMQAYDEAIGTARGL